MIIKRTLIAVLAILLTITSFPFSPPPVYAQDYDIPNGHFFTQTTGGPTGYSVVDDEHAPFWSEFQRLGGVQAVGYPISRRFLWNGFLCQVMQRVVFQWRPDLGEVQFVNTFDLFTVAGQDDHLFSTRSVPKPLPPEFDAGRPFAEVVQARLALLDDNAAIKAAYNGVVGDPVTMNGLPTSRVTDMGNHYALRTQRVVIQQWKEDVPWAAAGQATVALGGSIAVELGLFPPEVVEAESTPNEQRPLVSVPLPSAPTVAPAPAPTRATPLGYGFQLDPSEGYDQALQRTLVAGFGWVKYQTRWEEFEPEPGAYQWEFLDKVVNGTQSANLKLLLSVVTAPAWARPGQDVSAHGPPTNPQSYASFVGALAARYKGKVAAYEIWNEQNLGREWGGSGRQNAAAYVALLKAAHAAVKAADPQALVVTGALTPAGDVYIPALGGLLARDDLEYFKEMYAAGMQGYFDAVGVHPSGFNNAPDLDPRDPAVLARTGGYNAHRSFYFRTFEDYRAVMVENGDDDKQLWFTEFGWASGGNAGPEWAYAHENTEQQQAEWLVRAFQIGKEKPYIGVMFVWNLNFFGIDQAKRAFAVLNPDWTARPAYTALAAIQK